MCLLLVCGCADIYSTTATVPPSQAIEDPGLPCPHYRYIDIICTIVCSRYEDWEGKEYIPIAG